MLIGCFLAALLAVASGSDFDERGFRVVNSGSFSSSSGNELVFLENRVPCLDQSIRYRKRPNSTVVVSSHLSIISFHAFSAEHMDLTADVYFWQSWKDDRCSFRPLPGQGQLSTAFFPTSILAVTVPIAKPSLWIHIVFRRSADFVPS